MDLFQATEQRYSHKQPFADTPVCWEHLEQIAKAGLRAPTANNLQCVHLVILENKDAIAPMLDIAARKRLESAPAAIAVFTDSSNQGAPKNFEVEDYSAAAAHMLLAATALGYVSVWLDSPYWNEEAQTAACMLMGVPETFTLRVVLPIGLPAEEGKRREKKGFWERVSRNKYSVKE